MKKSLPICGTTEIEHFSIEQLHLFRSQLIRTLEIFVLIFRSDAETKARFKVFIESVQFAKEGDFAEITAGFRYGTISDEKISLSKKAFLLAKGQTSRALTEIIFSQSIVCVGKTEQGRRILIEIIPNLATVYSFLNKDEEMVDPELN